MEEARKRRLTLTGFIIGIAMFFGGFVYSVFFTDRKESYWSYFQQRTKAYHATAAAKRRLDIYEPIVLQLGEVATVGKIKLIYRGRADKMLSIGVIIKDLDPEMEYVHRIPLRQAEEGLRLGGMPFQVLSSSSSKLKLQRQKP